MKQTFLDTIVNKKLEDHGSLSRLQLATFCWRALHEPAHYSPIAGKSQNLSGIRSEARAVHWFSYYPVESGVFTPVR